MHFVTIAPILPGVISGGFKAARSGAKGGGPPREGARVSSALILLPLGYILFHSSYEASFGKISLNLEVIAILFAWFAALLRKPDLAPLIRFLSFFLLLGVGVTLAALRSGGLAGPLYFIQAMLFLSAALLPAALGFNRRDTRLLIFAFLALFALKLAFTNLAFGSATSDYTATTTYSFHVEGRSIRRAAILNFHANAFALLATIMTLYSLYLYVSSNKRLYMILYALHAAVSAHIILLTFSRSGFIAFGYTALVGLLILQHRRSSRLVGLFVAGAVVAGAAALLFDKALISYFFEQRLLAITQAAATNPRVEYAQYAFRAWSAAGPADWFFGAGFMHYYTDSTWPAILLNLGFVGVAVSLAGLCAIVRRIIRVARIDPETALVLAAILGALLIYGFSTEFWSVRKVLIPAALLFGLVYHDVRLAIGANVRPPSRKRSLQAAFQQRYVLQK